MSVESFGLVVVCYGHKVSMFMPIVFVTISVIVCVVRARLTISFGNNQWSRYGKEWPAHAKLIMVLLPIPFEIAVIPAWNATNTALSLAVPASDAVISGLPTLVVTMIAATFWLLYLFSFVLHGRTVQFNKNPGWLYPYLDLGMAHLLSFVPFALYTVLWYGT